MKLRHFGFALAISLGVFLPTLSVGAEDPVTYERFGAVGDGVHDDLSAICEAHEYANQNGLPVKTQARCHVPSGSKALTRLSPRTPTGTPHVLR